MKKGSYLVTFASTFLLRKVDPKKVRKEYEEGHFAERELPSSRIQVRKILTVSTPGYGTSPDLPCYTFKDKNNLSIVISTSNQRSYEIFLEKKSFPLEGRCEWHRQDFLHEGVGIPIRMEKRGLEQYIFWTEGLFCDFRCALAHILLYREIDPLYTASEYYLRFLFHLQYPDQELIPAPDYRLLKDNGGSLDAREFHQGSYLYHRSTNVILLPAKVEYLRK